MFSPGHAAAFEAKSGAPLWVAELGVPCNFEPVLAGMGVLITLETSVTCLDVYTGRIKWVADLGQKGVWFRTLSLATGNLMFLGDSDGVVHAFSTQDGVRLWKARVSKASNRCISGRLHVAGGVLIVGCCGSIFGLDLGTGAKIWQATSAGAMWNSGQLDGENVLVHSNGSVVSISPSGEFKRKFAWPGSSVRAVCSAGDILAFAVQSDRLVPAPTDLSMKYNPEHLVGIENGREIWRIPYSPWPLLRLSWSSETGMLYEATSHGVGVTDPASGVREVAITFQDSRVEQMDNPSVTRDFLYFLNRAGTVGCLRNPLSAGSSIQAVSE